MNRREFIKSSICFGCAGACGLQMPFANAEEIEFTPEEELAMQKFIYKNVDELPKKIRLDICNLCQLNCPACYMRLDEEKIIKNAGGFGFVSFEQYKDFVDKHSFIREIELSNHGEIFLNPDIDKILKYSFEKNIDLTAYTGVNLNTISEETAENLVKYKFKYLDVSIDAATPETYAIYRRGGDFNTVINNIKMINKYKEKYNSQYPILIYKFILFGHNEHEIEQAKKLAEELNTYIYFDVNFAPWYSPVKNRKKVTKLTGVTNFNVQNVKYLKDYKKGYRNNYICTLLSETPQINFNGDILGCCANYFAAFKGNAFKDGLLKALNSKDYLYAKLMLSDFKYKPKSEIPCFDCKQYNLIKKYNVPIKL